MGSLAIWGYTTLGLFARFLSQTFGVPTKRARLDTRHLSARRELACLRINSSSSTDIILQRQQYCELLLLLLCCLRLRAWEHVEACTHAGGGLLLALDQMADLYLPLRGNTYVRTPWYAACSAKFLPPVSFVFRSVPKRVWTQKVRNMPEFRGTEKELET